MKKVFLYLIATYALTPAWADDSFQKAELLLKSRCYDCHSHEKKIKGGLALDSRSGWEKGGKSGSAIVPGKPEASLLIKALSHAETDLKMPPKKMLPPEEIEVFKGWIKAGAHDPRVLTSAKTILETSDEWEKEFQKRLDWWSLKPLAINSPPLADLPLWSKEPVDRFLLARLKEKGLQPAPPASAEILLRRATFVLTGLPPTVEEVLAFKKDHSDAAYEKVVDRLLASPRYGERLARHWMDVVRYTDTYGYEWDNPAKGAFEYRDYLIRAFNDDIGFDRFLREQLAGDLLPTRIHKETQTVENLIAPMFYHLGEHRHGSSLMFNGIHQDMVNNKIDAFSKTFLAVSAACARCHDHKLEAVSQRDYYSLASLFTQARWTARPIDAAEKNAAAIAQLKTLREKIRVELRRLWEKTTLQGPALRAAVEKDKPAPGEILDPLRRLAITPSPAEWAQLKKEWSAAREKAKSANLAFTALSQVEKGELPKGWVREGAGFEHGYTQEATPLIALSGDNIVSTLLPAGIHTHALSSKLPGALRMPPQHLLPGKFVSLRLAGGEFAGTLTVDDHAFQNETISFFKNPRGQWQPFADAVLINGAQQVTVEVATAALNPNFPPRTGLAPGLPHNDFGLEKRSWFSLTGIMSHDSPGAPQEDQELFTSLYQREDPKTADEIWAAVADCFNAALRRWQNNQPKNGDHLLLNWLLEKKLLDNQAPADSTLAKLLNEYRGIDNRLDFPRTVVSMDEREAPAVRYPLNVRGNPDVSGALLSPGSLRMLQRSQAENESGNRLALANSLLDPEHPLTSRVYVNRVWQWVFGTGLVATPDDFGRLGDRPSHPELLDWLARQFILEGWSSKKLLRRLVLSQAFRQSGEAPLIAKEIDPNNRLLHHFATRRLEAEAIRDSFLAVSHRLDSKLYGPAVFPQRQVEDSPKRLFSGALDGGGRRSIYLQMSIMDPPKFLVGFNLPDLRLPTGKRDVTQVPSQALTLLNDPFVNQMAKQWAQSLARENHANVETRLRFMFLQAFAREPSAGELKRWHAALLDFSQMGKADLISDEGAWENLAHTLFNTKEFIYFQ